MEKIYSGGGFSNYFAMPEYQKDAVDNYLTNYYPNYPSTIWNSTGTVGFFSCLRPAPRILTKRFSLGHSPIFQPTGQIMLLPYVNKLVPVALCLQTSVRSIDRWSIPRRLRNVVFLSGRWSDLHDDQRCSTCSRQGAHRFRQPDGKFLRDRVGQGPQFVASPL